MIMQYVCTDGHIADEANEALNQRALQVVDRVQQKLTGERVNCLEQFPVLNSSFTQAGTSSQPKYWMCESRFKS